MIEQLERKNLIRKEKNTARSLEVILPREALPRLD